MKTAKVNDQNRVDDSESALTLAIAVLVERIQRLPKEDKEDLFHLSKALFTAETDEERESARCAFKEILEQSNGRVVQFAVDEEPIGLDGWVSFVGNQIRLAREDAGMTQEQLELATGLPQSHISRLENGVHSPSNSTLEKISVATGKPMAYFDPSHIEDQ